MYPLDFGPIPKNIFQTHKSIDYVNQDKQLAGATDTWKKQTQNGFNYFFYSDNDVQDFMNKFFPDIVNDFNRLPIPVMKADLWRYCVIYKYGGIYTDTDTVLNDQKAIDELISSDGKWLVLTPENEMHMCQWTFAAPKKSPLLKAIIDLSVNRIRNSQDFKGLGEHFIHYLTGPECFTDAIINFEQKSSYDIVPQKNHIFDYICRKNNLFKCINSTSFHEMVKHMFYGCSEKDGWTHQRKRFLLMK